jgi:hypothetical protein
LLPKRFVMSWQLRLRLLRFFHWLSLSLVAQLVSVDSGQPHGPARLMRLITSILCVQHYLDAANNRPNRRTSCGD